VRAALWGRENGVELNQIPEELLALCVRQGTGPLVFPMMLERADVPKPAQMIMRGVCVQTMQQHVQLQHTLQTAWLALTKAGIRPVLMKGAGLAALYPEPQQRQWGDIDLFVGKDQYHPACAVMRDTFPKALKFDEELDHYKHYNLIADGVSIEMHRVTVGWQHPVDERRYARMEARGVHNTRTLSIGDGTFEVFEPTFNALFVFVHAWEHMMTAGANLRQLCDLALLLHHRAEAIDRKQLRHDLSALRLMDVWQLYMYLLVEHLGLPETEAPFFTRGCAVRAERLLSDLLDGSRKPKDKSTQAPANRIARKFHTMQERLRDAAHVKAYSPAYGRHLVWTTMLHGARRFFAPDRHWE